MAVKAAARTALEVDHERGCPLTGEMVGPRLEHYLAELTEEARKGPNKLRPVKRTAIHCLECGAITLIDGDHMAELNQLVKEKLGNG